MDLTEGDVDRAGQRGSRRRFERYASFVALADASVANAPAADRGDPDVVVPVKPVRVVYGRPVI